MEEKKIRRTSQQRNHFFEDISYSISESSNTSKPVSISTSMRKRYSFLEDPIKKSKTLGYLNKKVNKSLKTWKTETHYNQGIYPNLKSEETEER